MLARIAQSVSGLTYSSGGLSVKSRSDLEEQRGAMAGAVILVAAMRAMAGLSLPINAAIPLCENFRRERH